MTNVCVQEHKNPNTVQFIDEPFYFHYHHFMHFSSFVYAKAVCVQQIFRSLRKDQNT